MRTCLCVGETLLRFSKGNLSFIKKTYLQETQELEFSFLVIGAFLENGQRFLHVVKILVKGGSKETFLSFHLMDRFFFIYKK